ncbi:MAG: hypothetical protein IJU98_12335 [Synergistaceae bacterium]|nr:hypothetical protein [Synergistaceae bacterium]
MGKFLDKVRQVFNLFLIMLLVAAVAAVFVYFLTDEAQRGTTFWMSVAGMAAGLILTTLFAAKVAVRQDGGRGVPGGFAQLFLVGAYFLFTLIIAVVNAKVGFSTTAYLLIHVGALAVFLIPLLLTNMAMLKQTSYERRAQKEGRLNLAAKAVAVEHVAEDLASAGVSAGELAPLRNLADSLRYSDPTPGPRDLEEKLERALLALETAAADSGAALRAVTAAARALEDRNAAVLAAK